MKEKMTHDPLAMIEYGDEPAVLLFGDSDAAIERARLASEHAGCRVTGTARVSIGAERLDWQVSADAVLVDVDADCLGFDLLLDRLETAARAGRCRAVISAPEELIDLVAARTAHANIVHLCNPSPAELASALALAGARRPAMLNDIGRGQGAALLQQLSAEAGRIATILASLSEDDTAAPAAANGNREDEGEEIDAAYVRSLIRARRLRDQFFRSCLFADPAWDMLLDLMAARLEGNRVAVSSLCIAAAVPATTALRWIKTLTDEGLLVRSADPEDGRRVYTGLSDEAARTMSAYLRAAQRIAPSLI